MINKSQGESGGGAFGLGGARPLWLLRAEQREREKGGGGCLMMDLLWLHTSVQHNGEEGGPVVVVVGSAGQHLAAETPGRGKPKIGRAKRGKVAQSGFFLGWMRKAILFSCENWEDGKKFGPSIFIRHPPIPQKERKTGLLGVGAIARNWTRGTRQHGCVCVCTGGRGLLCNKNIHEGSEMDVFVEEQRKDAA